MNDAVTNTVQYYGADDFCYNLENIKAISYP